MPFRLRRLRTASSSARLTSASTSASARTAQAVELDLSRYVGRVPVEMFGRTPFPPIGELPYLLTLGSRGFFWFQLTEAEEQ